MEYHSITSLNVSRLIREFTQQSSELYNKLTNGYLDTYPISSDQYCVKTCFSCRYLSRLKVNENKTIRLSEGEFSDRYLWVKALDDNIDNIMKTYLIIMNMKPHLINPVVHAYQCNRSNYIVHLSSEIVKLPSKHVAKKLLDELHSCDIIHGSIGVDSFARLDDGNYVFTQMPKSITKYNRPKISNFDFYFLQNTQPHLSEIELGKMYDNVCLDTLYQNF